MREVWSWDSVEAAPPPLYYKKSEWANTFMINNVEW